MVELNYASYCRKLKGCFMGKTVGGTLGMPLEGFIGMREVTYYDPVPTEMIANDDLDLQVVWLEVIRRRGLPVNRYDLAEGWLEHVSALPDEYGVAGKNLRVGLVPAAERVLRQQNILCGHGRGNPYGNMGGSGARGSGPGRYAGP